MPINSDSRFIGRGWIRPDTPVVAGAWGTWTLTYEVGAYGYDERARLKIASRFASDWGKPQFTDPKAANYTTVHLETKCETAVATIAFEPRGQVRPWFKTVAVAVADGSLYPGDRIHVTVGDRSGGGPGSRAQTFRERGCEFRFFVDPFGTELYVHLEASPRIDIVGGAFHRLVALAPTTVRPGAPFDALVKAEDVWGNPCERFDGEVRLDAVGGALAGLPASVAFKSGEVAVARLRGLRLATAGDEARVGARHGDARAESNLIRALGPGESKTWWGDLHGQTRATVGTGTIDEYFAFGRDVALLDMMSHQANDFQVTEEEWRRLKGEIERYHEDGRCVIFVGYEWSGMTPGGGDRNVMYRGDIASLHRSSHAEVDDMADAATDCFPVTELFAQFRGREPSRRVDLRGLWRAHLRAHGFTDARVRLRGHSRASVLRRHRRPAYPRRADRERYAHGRGRVPDRRGGRERARGGHGPHRAHRHLPRAHPRADDHAVHRRIVRRLESLPRGLGGLARARPGPAHHLGRLARAVSGARDRRRGVRHGESGEGHPPRGRAPRAVDLQHHRGRRRRRSHARRSARCRAALPH